jgi:hypothetical protein
VKNIQVIDDALNCVYDIFSATDDEFELIFPAGTDIAFIDEVLKRRDDKIIHDVFEKIWTRPVTKKEVHGIHGILFYGHENKKLFYPTRRDEEARNPDGTPLRKIKSARNDKER